jgi:signal recognition particle GTPase
MNLKEFCSSGSELKRKLEESFSEDVKRRKIDGDVSPEIVAEIISTITEPDQMLGPDVR